MSGDLDLTKRAGRKLVRGWRYSTAIFRTLPSFLIIGAAKSGTTSLYSYLMRHPEIIEPSKKEVHYFDYRYRNGVLWYRSFFPFGSSGPDHYRPITGEATPTYLLHPLAAERAHALLPKALIICMLRNPVDRVISSYHNQRRHGIEPLSLEEALEREEERTKGKEAKIVSGVEDFNFNHKYFSYVRRGIYADQLERWLRLYERDQIVIINSEEFFSDPRDAYGEIVARLGLGPSKLEDVRVFNPGGKYEGASPRTRDRLVELFRPHNERLFELIGRRFEWDD